MDKLIEDFLIDRAKTHGSFKDGACYTQTVKKEMRTTPNWAKLEDRKKEALDVIQAKIARILYGDPNFPDHWDDIQGYVIKATEKKA